jgi:hypothetical protein
MRDEVAYAEAVELLATRMTWWEAWDTAKRLAKDPRWKHAMVAHKSKFVEADLRLQEHLDKHKLKKTKRMEAAAEKERFPKGRGKSYYGPNAVRG